ncbi:MAG: 2-succinyl-5-enolpyruvyl-6-hydroxy-3-cyclohexene-1-carboxylic-acid synthase [Actinobacteria bacterium]|nr:2-succinyl-5-enolpyruvyl-6-hydroxy-3-cyclohexene-1-carboxylic-acid synthase [Actinomycetota bacterium]
MSETEGDVALRCAFAFVDQLAYLGLEHACVSPGSRSTPLALAFSRHPNVRVHVHLDERASAFFALGIAKAMHHPAAVVTTSGTAAAELLPAVIEASMSRTPLLLLTTDRPPELRGVGANQTIDQAELFGRQVKTFVEAPVPGEDPDEWRWRQLADSVAGTAVRHQPGPVHVNLPFREPLVPTADHDLQLGGRPVSMGSIFEQLEGGEFLDEMQAAETGVFLVGSLRSAAPTLLVLAERLGWPVIAEPTSGVRVPGTLAAGQFLLANEDFAGGHAPNVVVQVGAAPTSRAALAFVARAEQLWILDPDDLVADPKRVAAGRVVADPAKFIRAALARIDDRGDEAWLRPWLDADERTRAAVDTFLDGLDEPFEGGVARDLAASLPDGSTLVVGSSMPVRDLDTYMAPREGLRVLANRGASGIDGFVSTALGVAASGAPTTALCGDLTLLHDVGSLMWSARRGHDAVFVVPNNDGGAIFSFLPQRDLPEFEELFATPHGLDLGAICAAAGAGHTRVVRAGGLVTAVERARAAGGVHVVEVPTDRERNVELHAEVHAAVDAALRSEA